MDRQSGIYKIQSKIHPERIYIGSSVHIPFRFTGHRNKLKRNKHHSPKLQCHYNKYGIGDLIFEILELTSYNKESLIQREQYYIDTLHPWFNINHRADSNQGHICPEYTKKRVSESNKGKQAWNKGISPSPETITRMTESRHKRPNPSKETCEKNGASHRGKKRSLETRLKMIESRKRQIPPMLGKNHSEETKVLMSIKAKQRRGKIIRN